MFKPVTFDEQLVKSKNDGGLYNAVFVADGILWGCGITTTAAAVTFGSGEIMIGGRLIWIDGATTVQVTNPIQNGYARIKARIDLTKKATQTEIEQFAAVVEFSTTTLFPELTKENINNTGTTYEQELVVVKIDAGNVTAITRKMGNAIIDAEKLGGQLPEYYATKTAADTAQSTANAAVKKSGDTMTGSLTVTGTDSRVYAFGFVATGNMIGAQQTGKPFTVNSESGLNVKNASGSTYTGIGVKSVSLNGTSYILESGELYFQNGAAVRCTNLAGNAQIPIYASNVTGSSERFKWNITEMTDEEADQILQFVSVAFDWKEGTGFSGSSYSFIAERLADIDERFIYRNSKGEVEGILTNPLLAAQNHVVKRHEAEIAELKTQFAAMDERLKALGAAK